MPGKSKISPYRYVFRNTKTEELKESVSLSALRAARQCHATPDKGWMPWECWEGARCLWHYTKDHVLRDGPRRK